MGKKGSSEVLKASVNLTDAIHTGEELDRLKDFMKGNGLSEPHYLFAGVNASKTKSAGGRATTFAMPTSAALDEFNPDNVAEYTKDYPKSAIVVYDGKKMKPTGIPLEYKPIDGYTLDDALIAVVKLKRDKF